MLGNKKSKIRFFIFLTGLFLFLNSCGLDTFIVVEPPYSIGVGPNVDTEDYSYKNFQFSTNYKLSNYPSNFAFLATNVYYKIYTNKNSLDSQVDELNDRSNDFETSATASSLLINTYSYQPLQVMNYPIQAALVPATDIVNQDVYIRLTDYQKCVRTNDIEEVGDNRHLTYFEMLGNWSLGDYFKEESIAMSYEFLTKELEIPAEKLSVTCFAGDEDCERDLVTAECWKKAGIPEERIYLKQKGIELAKTTKEQICDEIANIINLYKKVYSVSEE